MKKTLPLLAAFLIPSTFAGAADIGTSADILKRVAERYKSLTSYQIEADEQFTMAQNGQSLSVEHKISLAVGSNGMFRVEQNDGRELEVCVSDGKITWKALPNRRIWSKQEVAEMPDTDSGDEYTSAPIGEDLFSQVQRSLVTRYAGLSRYPNGVLEDKTEKIRFSGNKTDCYVIQITTNNSANRLFIAKDSFLVLRHIELLRGRNGAQTQITTNYRKLLEGAPAPDFFELRAENGSKEVDDVSLPSERNLSLVGRMAADFTLKSLDGSSVRLSDLRGKIVLLDFWATWCQPCRRELPTIEAISRKYKDGNVVVFGVNDEETGTAKRFLEKNHPGLATLHDGDRKVHKLYGCNAIPTVLVIDPGGKIAAQFIGGREEPELVAALKQAGMN